MKSSVIKAFVAAATIAVAMPAMAQFNVGKAIRSEERRVGKEC